MNAMAQPKSGDRRRTVDMRSLVTLVTRATPPVDGNDAAARKRKLVAELCKVVGAHVSGAAAPAAPARADAPAPDSTAGAQAPSAVTAGLGLSPRLRQTLDRLLAGDSEKQIAVRLRISPHTVHVYAKQLHKRFGVSSRGELLARFVRGQ
jgi:DNA-binding CsgD family transcriptional regulator